MPAPLELLGNRFERLIVISKHPERIRKSIAWVCQCDCGNMVIIPGKDLKYGATKSCGCLQKEAATKIGELNKSHGLAHKTYLYNIWAGIKDRCSNINDPAYDNYGGRGISICAEWEKDFSVFARDVGERPTQKHTLDRIDNSLGYFKNNCRWITKDLQSRNRRKFKNNTSGVTGVYESSNGYWVARSTDLTGKEEFKCFSIKKFGYDIAKELAIQARKDMIEELNLQGAGYTEGHGK